MAEDQFDRLLDAMPRIAESVNAFSSEEVQRSAFQALVDALRLNGSCSPGAPKVQDALTDEAESGAKAASDDTNDTDTATDTDAKSSRRRVSRRTSGAKKNYIIPRGMNFAPREKPSLEEFVAEKQPRNQHERNLAAVYYLSQVMEENPIDTGKVLAVYKAAGWSAPARPDQALRNTASAKSWIDTADTRDIKLAWAGENYLENKMPQPAAAKA